MTVSELVLRIRDGPDPDQSFAELAGRFLAYIRRHIRRFVQNTADIEDLTQEVLIAVFQHIREYDPVKGTFATWLYTIIHNRCMSFLRGKHREEEVLAGYALAHQRPTNPALARLEDQLALLPEQWRELAWEHWGLGLTVAELAARHGLTRRQVRYRLASALAALRQGMGVHRPGCRAA